MGLFFFALGTLGIAVPLLPTVPFWILAAAFFASSSPALQARIYAHPQFGETVRDFVEQGALSRRSKMLSICGALAGLGLSLAVARPPALVVVAVVLVVLPTMVWLATRPNPVIDDGR